MKALTIWQPWASLWASAPHAPAADRGDGWTTLDYFDSLFTRPGELDHLPTGAVVGTALLTRCNLITEEFVAKLTPMERALGDFALGRYAWEFHGRVPADPPVPAKGMQGLWEWRGSL